MRIRMKIGAGIILLLLLNMYVVLNSSAQPPPLVYDVENTGVDCTRPPLPTFAELPIVEPLTDPFEWSDGSGRDTTFASWVRRRNEIKCEIENYEIGPKPVRPDTISASFANDTLTVNITKNGKTLTLTSAVILPEGTGPFPAVIGITAFEGMPPTAGSLSNDIFTSRDIAIVQFCYWQVMAHTQNRGYEPINRLYPDLIYMGAYDAWSWGISRLIDGLELTSGDLPIDLSHLAVTGCSFAGKMALFAGAFDERIALTIAQEPGGGGAAAWRVSETLGPVETLGSTSSAWFMTSMFQFAGDNVSKLPHDHHELVAMVAPRALFVLGNPGYVWLADESGYISCVAARKVWESFGIADRFGYSFVGNHDHCALPESEIPEIEAFVDKFLLGNTSVNTDITTNPYYDVYPEYWFDWWGKGDPKFPALDRGESEEVWYEAECGTVGAAWNVRLDTGASNGAYAVPKPGLVSAQEAPTDIEAAITFPFTVYSDTTFYLYGRVDCPTTNNNSFWVKMDDGTYTAAIDLTSYGWQWKGMGQFNLTAGDHTLYIAYRKESAKLDKICISVFRYPPGEKGETAEFVCEPDTTTRYYSALEDLRDAAGAFALGQNYPNPLNKNATISFEIPHNTYVSLKVYSALGEEIAELAGKEYMAGKHTVEFNARNLSRGIYFYTLKADGFLVSRKMIIQTE